MTQIKPIVFFILAAVLASSCTRTKYYTCYCFQTNGITDSIFVLGDITQHDAYPRCTEHNHDNDSCITQERN